MIGSTDPRRKDDGQIAIEAGHCIIKGRALIGGGFICIGGVHLSGADVKGALVCSNGVFFNPCGKALVAFRSVFQGDVFLSKGEYTTSFLAIGSVWFSGSAIKGSLFLADGEFLLALSAEECGKAFVGHGMRVSDALYMHRAILMGRLDLSHANIGRLDDDGIRGQKGRLS